MLKEIRNNLMGEEMNFAELDNYMMQKGFYSVFDDGVTADIKQDKNVVYTSKTTNEAEVSIDFEIVHNNGEDEAVESFILKVLEVEKF